MGKEMEIIKQLFDIATLFDIADNAGEIKDNFHRIAKQEIYYRGLEIKPDDVLSDIFETSAIITYRGQKKPECFNELLSGIKKIVPFILTQGFTLDFAIQCASKAAYLAMILLRDVQTFEKYSEAEAAMLKITNPEFNKLNKLKKTDLIGFYYWCKAIELYKTLGISKGSVTFRLGIGIPL